MYPQAHSATQLELDCESEAASAPWTLDNAWRSRAVGGVLITHGMGLALSLASSPLSPTNTCKFFMRIGVAGPIPWNAIAARIGINGLWNVYRVVIINYRGLALLQRVPGNSWFPLLSKLVERITMDIDESRRKPPNELSSLVAQPYSTDGLIVDRSEINKKNTPPCFIIP